MKHTLVTHVPAGLLLALVGGAAHALDVEARDEGAYSAALQRIYSTQDANNKLDIKDNIALTRPPWANGFFYGYLYPTSSLTLNGDSKALWATAGNNVGPIISHYGIGNSSLFLRDLSLVNVGEGSSAIRVDAQSNNNASLSVVANPGKRSLFYATSGNAIAFSNSAGYGVQSTANVTINAAAGSQVLMFNPLFAQGDQYNYWYGGNYNNLGTTVTKTGAGQWLLGGASQMGGALAAGASTWAINAGELRLATVQYTARGPQTPASVNLNAAGSRFTLGPAATLGGTGTIKAPSIVLNGTLDPDTWVNTGRRADEIRNAADIVGIGARQSSAIGTLTLQGNTTLGASSTYIADINGGVDRLVITGGTATINPDAQLLIRNDSQDWTLRTPMSVVTTGAGGRIAGGYGQNQIRFHDSNSPLLLKPVVSSTANGVNVRIEADRDVFMAAAGSRNQQAVADALLALTESVDRAGVSRLRDDLLKIADADVAHLPAWYNNLSGEIYSSTRSALLGSTPLVLVMGQRMQGSAAGGAALGQAQPVLVAASNGVAPAPAAVRNTLWASTWGVDGELKRSGAAKLDQSGYGLALGGEAALGNHLTGGVLLAFEDQNFKNGQSRHARTDVQSYSVGAYLAGSIAEFSLRGGLAYSRLDLDTKRRIIVAPNAGQLKASYDADKVQAFVEAAFDVELGEATVSPYVNLTHVWLHSEGWQEKGSSSAALSSGASTDNVSFATLGVRAAYRLPVATPVSVYGDLGWVHAFGDTHVKSHNTLTHGANQSFKAHGVGVAKDSALVGLGVQANLSQSAALSLGYQGQFGSGRTDHSANLQVKVAF